MDTDVDCEFESAQLKQKLFTSTQTDSTWKMWFLISMGGWDNFEENIPKLTWQRQHCTDTKETCRASCFAII